MYVSYVCPPPDLVKSTVKWFCTDLEKSTEITDVICKQTLCNEMIGKVYCTDFVKFIDTNDIDNTINNIRFLKFCQMVEHFYILCGILTISV